MTDTEVVVVSLAIGFGIGVVLLMVLWACRACLGKPNTADDDTAANIPPRRQSAMTSEDTGQRVNVQLSSRPEQVRQDASVCSQIWFSIDVYASVRATEPLTRSVDLARATQLCWRYYRKGPAPEA